MLALAVLHLLHVSIDLTAHMQAPHLQLHALVLLLLAHIVLLHLLVLLELCMRQQNGLLLLRQHILLQDHLLREHAMRAEVVQQVDGLCATRLSLP